MVSLNLADEIKAFIFKRNVSALDELIRNGLTVGKRVYFHSSVVIDSEYPWLITIGDRCSFSVNVIILAHDASTQKYLDFVKVDKVVIGSRTFVGAGTIILPGVSIGTDVIIGAGSVVTRDIPSDCVAAGNPAHVIGKTSDFVEKHKRLLEPNPRHIRGAELEKPEVREMIKKELADGPYYI
jgi:maltose O-acetyltransferase